MAHTQSLKGQFLIAMPGLAGSFFGHTVSYLCDHDEEGAMGLVLNKPLPISEAEILEQLDIPCQPDDTRKVFNGGPVQPERGFVLHCGPNLWEADQQLDDDIFLSSSLEILRAIGTGEGPREYRILLGYSGWGAGQLEQELADNSWLTVPATRELIFSADSSGLPNAAARSLGIDLNLISAQAGHG